VRLAVLLLVGPAACQGCHAEARVLDADFTDARSAAFDTAPVDAGAVIAQTVTVVDASVGSAAGGAAVDAAIHAAARPRRRNSPRKFSGVPTRERCPPDDPLCSPL
jgi:hypothetical protein